MIRRLYNRLIRDHLPYKIGVYNGVAVDGKIRLLDSTDVILDYKRPNVDAIRATVEKGNTVVVVGGGVGVTSVVAARQTGQTGDVTVFEASEEQVTTTRETLRINRVNDWSSVNHTVVGSINDAGGELGTPSEISPTELPECDVIEFDCEGAEANIISEMSISPSTIIVETHPRYGSPTESVKSNLREKGYTVVHEEPEAKSGDVLTARISD